MTAFGPDRPGVVADVTELVYEHECNLEDSTMTRLRDEFAIILLFSGSENEPDVEGKLTRACRRLEREKNISAFIRPVQKEKAEKPAGTPTLLHVEGVDHTGIVYRISRHLADQGINIANLTSRRDFLPESGTATYHMEILLDVPSGITREKLAQGLSRLENELQVDISF
jgi:glycine cleavage system transcriptional repressor